MTFKKIRELIKVEDIKTAILSGKVIEERLDDPRGESRLVAGLDRNGETIHVVIGIRFGFPVIVTVYKPDKDKWISGIIRKRKKYE